MVGTAHLVFSGRRTHHRTFDAAYDEYAARAPAVVPGLRTGRLWRVGQED